MPDAQASVLADPAGTSPQPTGDDRFSAEIQWWGDEPLAHGRSYLLVQGPVAVPAVVTSLRHRVDPLDGHSEVARNLGRHDAGRVELATDSPVALRLPGVGQETEPFYLVDRLSGATVAMGILRYALRRSGNVQEHDFTIDRVARESMAGHRGRVLWLTGLSGSGKSTIADGVERDLFRRGYRTFVLDGDNVRHGLNKDLGFTAEDRAENVRRVAEVARLMMSAGCIVIVALVSPFRSDRWAARQLFSEGDFVEVAVRTPVEVCARRDPKGLYAKAAAGQLPNLTGIGQDYEEPLDPELVVSGDGDLDAAVAVIVDAATIPLG